MIENRKQTRRNWLGACAGIAGATALAGCSGSSDDTSSDDTSDENVENGGNGDAQSSNWPMYGVDLQNTGYHPSATGPDGNTVTKRPLLDREGRGAYQSTVVDNILYVSDMSGQIKALNLETEEMIWNAERSGPSIVHDGTVYGPREDGRLYGYDAVTGDRWESEAVDSLSGLGLLRPIPTERGIFVASRETVWQFDPETGEYDKVIETPLHAGGTTNWPAVYDDTLFIGRWSKLHAVNLDTPEIEWTFEPEDGGSVVNSNPTVDNGMVYLASYDRRLHAIDIDTGTEEWAIDTISRVDASPAVANGIVYLGEREQVIAVDAENGDLEWKAEDAVTGEPEDIVVADNICYVTTRTGISAYDAASGDLEWEYEVPDGSDAWFNTPPTIFEGTIYLSSADETLYAIEDA